MLAVAGDDQHPPLRLRLREAEPDQRGAAHRAPEIEVGVVVAGGIGIVGRRAEPADDQQVAAIREQRRDRGAPVELVAGRAAYHFFAPIRRCDISTAIC